MEASTTGSFGDPTPYLIGCCPQIGFLDALKNGVANENSLIVPAAMITILCQPQ
jgi:hypothetical protein